MDQRDAAFHTIFTGHSIGTALGRGTLAGDFAIDPQARPLFVYDCTNFATASAF
jgi:hypothetical protein